LICGVTDPTLDLANDTRIIASNLFTINLGGVSIIATDVRQPEKMKQFSGVISEWHFAVLLPNDISMDKVQTLDDVRKLRGKIIAPQYWE
jgi:hypothetical protein